MTIRRIGHNNVADRLQPVERAINGTSGASGSSHTAHNPTAAHNVDLAFPRGICIPPDRTPGASSSSSASRWNRCNRINPPAPVPDGTRQYVSMNRIARARRDRVRHDRHGGRRLETRVSSAALRAPNRGPAETSAPAATSAPIGLLRL